MSSGTLSVDTVTAHIHDCSKVGKVQFFFKENCTFIQQGCFKLIQSDIKDIYNVTKDFYFK